MTDSNVSLIRDDGQECKSEQGLWTGQECKSDQG